jgi:pilus assembly protein CpaF
MAGFELPIAAIREQMSSALHLIVQIARHADGVRRITTVTEVSGMEGAVITMQDIFTFKQAGIDAEGKVVGEMRATGLRPKLVDRIKAFGIEFGEDIFNVSRWG